MNDEIMSQAAAVDRAWAAAVRAEQAAESRSFQNTLMWSEVARSWAAVAGQLEFITTEEELAPGDCLRIAPDAEYCPAAGSPRCAGCTWRPADEPALTESTQLVPTLLPTRDPGATVVMSAVPTMCNCDEYSWEHPIGPGCP